MSDGAFLRLNSLKCFLFVHLSTLLLMGSLIVILFWKRKSLQGSIPKLRRGERYFAFSLLAMDMAYHSWLIATGRWGLRDALPLRVMQHFSTRLDRSSAEQGIGI